MHKSFIVLLVILSIFHTACVSGTKRVSVGQGSTLSVSSCAVITDTLEKEVCFRAQSIEANKRAENDRKRKIASDSPAMHQARREVESRLKKQQGQSREVQWILAHTQIRGCKDNPPIVVLDRYTPLQVDADDNTIYVYRNAYMHDYRFMHVLTTATNGYDTRADIRLNGEMVIQNMCSGGTLALNAVIDLATGGPTVISYTAEARGGGTGTRNSSGPSTTLYGCQNCPTAQVQIWRIGF